MEEIFHSEGGEVLHRVPPPCLAVPKVRLGGLWVSWAQAGGWDEMIFKGSSTPKQPVGLFTSPFGSLAEAPSVSQPRAGRFWTPSAPPSHAGEPAGDPEGWGP